MTDLPARSATSRFAHLSLSLRLSLAIGVILVAGGIVVALAALAYGQQAAQTTFDRLLVGAANQISASITIVDGSAIVDLPVTALELLALARDDRIVYRVVGPDSETLTGSEAPAIPPLEADVSYFYDTLGEEPVRLVAVRRHFAERGYSGTVTTLVGHTLRAREGLAWEIVRSALGVLAIAALFMFVLAGFAVWSALAPLRRIERALLARDPKDVSRLDIAVPRELNAIVGAINRFMSRINRQMEMMQNLISDSAHQLRTPITALRAQAQLALEEPDPARRNDLLDRIHLRAVRLSRLTDQMLNRAMVIHRTDASSRETLDLRKVAIAAAESFDDGKIFESGALRLDMPDDALSVRGDFLSLVEATKNLISNALTHGRAPVGVHTGMRDAKACLWVSDRGEGLDENQLKSIGGRFARKDATGQGRTASASSGSGIGLSIASAVAQAHGGGLFTRKHKTGFEIGFHLEQPSHRGSE